MKLWQSRLSPLACALTVPGGVGVGVGVDGRLTFALK